MDSTSILTIMPHLFPTSRSMEAQYLKKEWLLPSSHSLLRDAVGWEKKHESRFIPRSPKNPSVFPLPALSWSESGTAVGYRSLADGCMIKKWNLYFPDLPDLKSYMGIRYLLIFRVRWFHSTSTL